MAREDLRKREGWNNRYSPNAQDKGYWGDATHTPKGNLQYHRMRIRALDRCLRVIGRDLRGARILDAAGGTGVFVPCFLQRGAAEVVVTDFSEVAIATAHEQYKNEPRVTCQVAELSELLPGCRGRFDFIFVHDAIFLLPDDAALERSLVSLSRMLAQGGHIIIADIFPEQRRQVGSYIVRRPRAMFEQCLSQEGLQPVAYVPQTVLFHRRVFGRLQAWVETMGSLLYWLDLAAMAIGLRPPESTAMKYLIGVKSRP